MKKEEKVTKKFDYRDKYEDIVIEDREEVYKIASIATDRLNRIFGITFRETEKDPQDPRIPLIIFTETYDAVIDHLVKRRKGLIKNSKGEAMKFNNSEINFANRFIVGFDNIDNDDDEKDGNFMIFINHIKENKTVDEPREDDSIKPVEKAIEWVNQNITKDTESIKAISLEARSRLRKLDIAFTNHELIMPIFCIIYDTMIEYIDLRRKEQSDPYEYEINFAGCFFVTAREAEDGDSVFVFRPSIDSKMALKDDATSGN